MESSVLYKNALEIPDEKAVPVPLKQKPRKNIQKVMFKRVKAALLKVRRDLREYLSVQMLEGISSKKETI
ncbi:MAG: hypothetical protein PHI66_00955 [Candidatus Pacebacteria bacterium]|nr:hypothetical protein [Candidatus Paceibacterota bacterium]